MKNAILAALILSPGLAHAGAFVQKNMYTNAHFVLGVGHTLAAAVEDAKSAIPKGTKQDFYEPDSDFNGPEFQCLNGVLWTEKDGCWGGDYQSVIPLRHVTR